MKEVGLLHPFPDGWYLVEPSARLKPNQVVQKTWMGREIVAWRNGEGGVCVADAYCPHLGAHLGPKSGGTVRAGNLVCPFHGFEYNITGQCVATPHAPPPKRARLTAYPIMEVNGFVFGYWDHQGRAPAWRIPEVAGNVQHRVLTRRTLRSHPQATTENSVDFSHLSYVHGYQALEQVGKTTIDGPRLTARYKFTRRMLAPGLRWGRLPVDITISVWGLGVSFVEIQSPTTGLEVLQWVLATPVDGALIDLWLGVDPRPPKRRSFLGHLPKWLNEAVVPKILLRELVMDVMKDAAIWKHQRYVAEPMFSGGERDMHQFRRYCAQFYPEPGVYTDAASA